MEYRRGRRLTLDDADWLESVVRRITALLDLGPELDARYAAAKASSSTPGHSADARPASQP